MKYLRRKTKKYTTKKSAEDAAKNLGLTIKRIKGNSNIYKISKKNKYSKINLSENNEIMTEKEITTEAEMIEDKDVDSTQIHFCTHMPDGTSSGSCKLLSIEEAKRKFVKIKEVEKVVKLIVKK